MAIALAPMLIDAPPPPPRPYGLFDAATGPLPFPAPQVGDFGLIYVPDDCVSDVFLYSLNCPAVSGSKTFSAIDATVSGSPFAVIVSYTCSALGWSPDEVQQRLATRLMLREQRGVERRLWQGQQGGGLTLGAIPGLFRGATNLGTAGCVTEATEMLEQALADNGVVGGMIHARPGVNAHMANSVLLRPGTGRTLQTWYGTTVCFGQGYDGTGPNGEAVTTDTEYMYATGRVLVYQEPEPFMPPYSQVFNTANNQVSTFMERRYALVVECGVWTVQVTRNCTTAN